MFGLWRVVAGGLASATVVRLLAIAGSALVGAIVLDGVGALVDGRNFFDHYSDSGIIVLLFIMMVLPLWGLFDERLLSQVGELGIAVLGLTAAAQVADRGAWVAAAGVAVGSTVVAALVFFRRGGVAMPVIGYGCFLINTVVLAVLEGDHALALLNDDVVEVEVVSTLMGFAALMWLAFHSVFASKFVLIALTCLRVRGRQLACEFGARMVTPSAASPMGALGVVVASSILLGTDLVFDWASDGLLVAAMIFVLPIIEATADRASGSTMPDARRVRSGEPANHERDRGLQ